MIGQTVSHYKILSKLGEGGMGVVYKAEDTKLGRPVALKCLPPELTRDKNAKARFIHEARAASALQHNNICAIHEIDETPEGQLFICMDCYDGETLKEKIARGPLLVEEAVDIASQVAAGLSKAHEAGMVHRDIKPANIMVTTDGVVKILDFGLAKLAGQTKMTRTGTTVGTVSYMSPEQARGEEVDARSDIFSLGAVLYEMLTGAVPFPGDHEAAVLYGIIHGEPKPLVEVDKSIPQELQGIIDRALKKDPKERYQNVLDLGDDLDAAVAGAEEGGKKLRRKPRRLPDAARKARTQRRIAVGAAAGVVLVIVGLILGPRFWKSVQVTPAHALAVMDFRDLATPDDPTVSAGMTEFMNIGLIQADLVRVVSSDLLHDLRRRLFGSPRGAIEESQTIEIARQARATLFLTGTIRPSGTGMLVTWHLVDVQSGDDVKAGRVEGSELAPLVDQMIAEALPFIARKCGVEATKAPTAVENISTASPRAYQHYMAGTLALQEIRPEGAIAEFERAVAQDSTFALAYLWLGQIYSGYNDYKRANECLDKAWRLRSRLGTKDQMRLEAARYNSNGPISEAVRVRREMYKRWPDDLQTLRDLQTQLFSRWYFGEAQEVATEARRYYPDDIQIFRYYSLSLLILGRVEEGLRATRSWVKQRPNEPAGWFTLSFMYVASAMPDSADAAYRKVVELDPGVASEDPGYPCALTYYRGDLKGATTCLEEFVGKTDFSESARQELTRAMRGVGLVGLYIEAGRYQKARDVCRDHMSPSRADLYQFRILNAMGQAREVRDLYEQWTKADSTNDYPHQLGIALATLGDVRGAREAARRLSGMEFDWGAMAHYCAFEVEAKAALADHDPKTALEFLGKMKQFGVIFGFYIDIDYRTMLAAAYKMDGRLQEAADVHKEMLRIYGGHALSHYELGQLYEEMKRPADAKKQFTKFLEMWTEADEGLPQLVDAKQRLAAL